MLAYPEFPMHPSPKLTHLPTQAMMATPAPVQTPARNTV